MRRILLRSGYQVDTVSQTVIFIQSTRVAQSKWQSSLQEWERFAGGL